jgi:hypothetical protein
LAFQRYGAVAAARPACGQCRRPGRASAAGLRSRVAIFQGRALATDRASQREILVERNIVFKRLRGIRPFGLRRNCRAAARFWGAGRNPGAASKRRPGRLRVRRARRASQGRFAAGRRRRARANGDISPAAAFSGVIRGPPVSRLLTLIQGSAPKRRTGREAMLDRNRKRQFAARSRIANHAP